MSHIGSASPQVSLGIRLHAGAVPRLEGIRVLALGGAIPGGSRRNRASLKNITRFSADIDETEKIILCDPQSSGDLVFAVPPDQSASLIRALNAAGTPVKTERALGCFSIHVPIAGDAC